MFGMIANVTPFMTFHDPINPAACKFNDNIMIELLNCEEDIVFQVREDN